MTILIIVNVSVFMFQLLFSSVSTPWPPQSLPLLPNEQPEHLQHFPEQYGFFPEFDKFTKLFWLYPPHALGQLWLWQFFTYMFLHSTTDPWHLIFNVIALWMFGGEIERILGSRRFLTLYLTAGIFAGLCSSLFTPQSPIVGASAAILAIMVVFGMHFPNSTVVFYFFPIKAMYLVMIFTGITIFQCITPKNDTIAYIAHLSGLLFGFLFVRYSYRVEKSLMKWQIYHHEKEFMKEQELREKVDKILEKVNREGLQNLTWKERNFLKNASKRYKKNRK